MKKRLVLLTAVICAFWLVCSLSVVAAEQPTEDENGAVYCAIPLDVDLLWESPYTDVSEDSWYYEYVRFMTTNKFLNGIESTLFGPEVNMSRGMVVTVLYRMAGEPDVTYSDAFSDVPAGAYYSDAVEWAAANEIVFGRGNGIFAPLDDVTRQDFVVILYRFAQYMGYDVSFGESELDFPDVSDMASYAQDAMKWACAAEVISGTTVENDTRYYLKPTDFTTRAQVAKMLSVFTVKYMEVGETSGVIVSPSLCSIAKGETVTVYPLISPDSGYAVVTWSTSDPAIAAVSDDGVVTGIGSGQATITCTTFDGKNAECIVVVTDSRYDEVMKFVINNGEKTEDGNYTFYRSGTAGDMNYTEGFCYDPSVNELCLDSFIDDLEKGLYSADVCLHLSREGKQHTATIEFYDEDKDITLCGTAVINAASFGNGMKVSLDSVSCNEDPSYPIDAKTREVVRHYLETEVHHLLSLGENILETKNVNASMKDFGFTSYRF